MRHVKSVFLANGTLSASAVERQLRWQEYFCQLYGGRIAQDSAELSTASEDPLPLGVLNVSVTRTEAGIANLGVNRAAGPDGISAKLWKAGGCPVAVAVNKLQVRVFADERWPVAWKATVWLTFGRKSVMRANARTPGVYWFLTIWQSAR